jgi:hypothetical protein
MDSTLTAPDVRLDDLIHEIGVTAPLVAYAAGTDDEDAETGHPRPPAQHDGDDLAETFDGAIYAGLFSS